MFVDTHAHLTDEQFSKDLEAVLLRAAGAGVTRILTLGTDVASSRVAIALAEKYAAVYAAVGIHPEAVRQSTLDEIKIIRELAEHPKAVVIGEIGLDYYWDKESADLQQEFFVQQLELAAELKLPVSVHDREAHTRIIETLQSAPNVRGVLHAFSGDAAMAHQVIELGWMISFAGPVTFLNARQTHALAQELPLGKILLETDAPYLSPHPLRGRRNEPANVARIAARIAELKNLTVEQVAAQTTNNARVLFGF